MKPTELHETISKLLSTKLQPLTSGERELNLVSCIEIYTTIFDTLVEVLVESGINVPNEAMNFLAQCYYDGILVNGREELDPDIFTQRAKVEEIETKHLAMLAAILNGTDFAVPIIQEIKKRS